MATKKAEKEKKPRKNAKAANARPAKATKAAKAKPAPKAKAKAPKIVRNKGETKAASGGIGHNSGEVNKALVVLFDDYAALDEQAKEIAKAKRDVRAKAKEEHGVLSSVFNHEVKLRKLDRDVRVQFEQGHNDLKGMLGYQLTLDLIAQEREAADAEHGEDGGEGQDGEQEENLNDDNGQGHDEEGAAA